MLRSNRSGRAGPHYKRVLSHGTHYRHDHGASPLPRSGQNATLPPIDAVASGGSMSRLPGRQDCAGAEAHLCQTGHCLYAGLRRGLLCRGRARFYPHSGLTLILRKIWHAYVQRCRRQPAKNHGTHDNFFWGVREAPPQPDAYPLRAYCALRHASSNSSAALANIHILASRCATLVSIVAVRSTGPATAMQAWPASSP